MDGTWVTPPLEFYELLNGFGFAGTRANAIFLRVDIEGELAQNNLSGYNVLNGIQFEGDGTGFGPTEKLISGSLVVSDSIFRSMSSATGVSNISDSWILITGNTCEDVYDAGDLSDLLRSRYEFSFNTVQTTTVYNPTYGCAIYDQDKAVSNVTSSEILISHNVFTIQSSAPSGSAGIGIAATFAGGSRCQILSNNFQAVNVLGIYLGPGTSNCIVAGNGNTTIQNLGTNNVIVNTGPAP
jgi:hypothetical protein